MNLAVLGPGLLGASIALAARRAGTFRTALWARRAEAIAAAQERGIGDFVSGSLADVVRDAALVVLCVPIGVMPALAREIAPLLPPGALVTDVGSVKQPVVADLETLVPFVGSHPMAGSEQQGMDAARADLFDGQVCIVTPTATTPAESTMHVTEFWKSLGGVVRTLSPAEHDRVVATISHLPHVLAAALVNAVTAQAPEAFAFAGPGFRDTTRIAGGAPEMWSDILVSNREAVRTSTEAMIEKLREFLTLLDSAGPGDQDSMRQFLLSAKTQRDRLRQA